MKHLVSCYRCGVSLSEMSLPFSRRDQCPQCTVDLHVCRMCTQFDPGVPKKCREDDAEEVMDKELANFCEWFEPSESAFEPGRKSEADRAREALEALFSGLKDKN